MKNELLTDQELLVLASFRQLVQDGFGELRLKVHRGQLTARQRTVSENVPPRRLREVGKE